MRRERVRRTTTAPVLESLETRQLLALFTGFSHVRHIATASGIYSLELSDQAVLKVSPAGNGQIDVKVLGSTSSTTLTITQIRPRYHMAMANQLLTIHNLTIKSGQIGSILATPAELDGTMTPLTTAVTTLDFGVLGPAAQVDVNGSVNAMNVGQVLLGPNGHVIIAGNLNGTTVPTNNSTTSASGTGSVTINGTVTGTITATGTGSGTAPTTPQTVGAITIGTMAMDGGEFVVVGDSVAPIQITNDMSLSHNGLFSIGQDQTGSFSIGGSLILDSGGELAVGRDLSSLTVNGDVLVNPGASGIVVGGNLNGFTVNGIFRGQGSSTAVDLGVGLNLNGFNILGGTSNLILHGTSNPGGLQSANINVGKNNINGLDVPHGIFLSWITAGVSINDVKVGAYGVTAIYNSEIDAGTSITNVAVGGNVKSGFPTGDISGYPTRIIAGKVRGAATGSTPNQGNYLPNGSISKFAISGALIDAVLAASVAPFGGDGPLGGDGNLPPPLMYGVQPQSAGSPPGVFTNYQAPAGMTDTTTPAGLTDKTPNYSIRDVSGGAPKDDAAAWAAPVGSRHDTVLNNGSIDAKTVTVTGGVISTQTDPRLDDTYDYAGFFAVNTIGVASSQTK